MLHSMPQMSFGYHLRRRLILNGVFHHVNPRKHKAVGAFIEATLRIEMCVDR